LLCTAGVHLIVHVHTDQLYSVLYVLFLLYTLLNCILYFALYELHLSYFMLKYTGYLLLLLHMLKSTVSLGKYYVLKRNVEKLSLLFDVNELPRVLIKI